MPESEPRHQQLNPAVLLCSFNSSLISLPHPLPHPVTQFNSKQKTRLILTQSCLLPFLEFFQFECLSPLIYSCNRYLLNMYHMLGADSEGSLSWLCTKKFFNSCKSMIFKMVTWLHCLFLGCIFSPANLMEPFSIQIFANTGWNKFGLTAEAKTVNTKCPSFSKCSWF